MALQALSLERLLPQCRNARGMPPSSVISAGVACLSVRDMQNKQLTITQLIRLSFQNESSSRKSIVQAWPLDAVDEGFVALDSATLATLGLLPNDLPLQLSSLKSPKRRKDVKSPRSNRKSGKADKSRNATDYSNSSPQSKQSTPRSARKSRRETVEDSPDVQPVKKVVLQSIPFDSQIAVIDSITLSVKEEPELLSSHEYRAMIHRVLIGRVLIKGMKIPVTMLGRCILLTVVDISFPENAQVSEQAADTPARFETVTEIFNAQDTDTSNMSKNQPNKLAAIGGLDQQIEELLNLARPVLEKNTISNGTLRCTMKPPRGVLLHGPPGTGKTMLACAISQAFEAGLQVVFGPEILGNYSDEAITNLESVFNRASRQKPCVIVLDEIDALSPKRDAVNTDNVQRKLTAALLTILDGHDDTRLDRVFVIGTTNRPDAIDQAMRRPGRFDREIEISVPDNEGRYAILNCLTAKAKQAERLDVSDEQIKNISNIAYGFVGADLAALWRECVNNALKRSPEATVTHEDFSIAMKVVRPSALREVAVEIPSVKWNDIGGKEEAKQRLRESVEWPLTEEGTKLFKSIGVSPPKGILLFGPPGCSKTLLAKAVATESGANFISVKGPELLSKWVGASEKAVRTIFRRARMAAPCVIFFDEIDALATSRSLTPGASAQARVVAQLLTEMDGIDTGGIADGDPANRVVVIAATNRPDLLDKALLRPGRIDVQIHIGLPDKVERLSILEVHTRKVPVAEDVNLEYIADESQTGGFSGAEVSALVREAALAAMEEDLEGADCVKKAHFDIALSRIRPRTPAHILSYFDDYLSKLVGRCCVIK